MKHVNRSAMRADRLCILRTHTLGTKQRRGQLSQDLFGVLDLIFSDLQTDTTDHVRVEPVHTDHFVVGKFAGDAGRFQLAQGDVSGWKVTEAADRNELGWHGATINRDSLMRN